MRFLRSLVRSSSSKLHRRLRRISSRCRVSVSRPHQRLLSSSSRIRLTPLLELRRAPLVAPWAVFRRNLLDSTVRTIPGNGLSTRDSRPIKAWVNSSFIAECTRRRDEGAVEVIAWAVLGEMEGLGALQVLSFLHQLDFQVCLRASLRSIRMILWVPC